MSGSQVGQLEGCEVFFRQPGDIVGVVHPIDAPPGVDEIGFVVVDVVADFTPREGSGLETMHQDEQGNGGVHGLVGIVDQIDP